MAHSIINIAQQLPAAPCGLTALHRRDVAQHERASGMRGVHSRNYHNHRLEGGGGEEHSVHDNPFDLLLGNNRVDYVNNILPLLRHDQTRMQISHRGPKYSSTPAKPLAAGGDVEEHGTDSNPFDLLLGANRADYINNIKPLLRHDKATMPIPNNHPAPSYTQTSAQRFAAAGALAHASLRVPIHNLAQASFHNTETPHNLCFQTLSSALRNPHNSTPPTPRH